MKSRRATTIGVAAVLSLGLVSCAAEDAEDPAAPTTTEQSATETSDDSPPASEDSPVAAEDETPAQEAAPESDTPVDVKAVAPGTTPVIAVSGEIDLPAGEPGQLAIVAQGIHLDRSGTLPVVVRNMTDRPVVSVEVTGIARDAGGGLVGSGSDQGLDPYLVNPGEISFGYVYFGIDEDPGDLTFELSVTASEPDPSRGKIDLVVQEHNATADSIVVLLQNDTSELATGPIGVGLLCFDESGVPVSQHSTYTDQDEVAPGGTASGAISFYRDAPCASYLLASSAWRD